MERTTGSINLYQFTADLYKDNKYSHLSWRRGKLLAYTDEICGSCPSMQSAFLVSEVINTIKLA